MASESCYFRGVKGGGGGGGGDGGGHWDKTKLVTLGYKKGSILRVLMKNFLTYDACEVFPGPKLNLGKVHYLFMLCGVCVACIVCVCDDILSFSPF